MNQKKKKNLAAGLAAVCIAGAAFLLYTWYGTQASHQLEMPMASGVSYAMDTVIEQKWYGQQAQAVYSGINLLLQELEQQISMHIASSEIAAVNAGAGNGKPVQLTERTYQLLRRSKELSQQSQGAFDITIAPVAQLWGITGDNPRVPQEEELQQALELVGIEHLILDDAAHTAYLDTPGMAIDLGGLAKGWTCDVLRSYAQEQGVQQGYVSLGGNLMVMGKKPDGTDFKFGLRDPQGPASDYVGILTLEGKNMATTGAYERYFEQDGVRYHHVLDPQTGYPAESDLLSVTVISEDGILGDFLSTTLFVQGKEAALSHLEEEEYSLIVIDKEQTVYLSPNLEGIFQVHEGKQEQYRFLFGAE